VGLKLKGTHQLVVYFVVNVKRVYTNAISINAEALVDYKEFDLEGSIEKVECMLNVLPQECRTKS
jgi:hypothetical protein